MRSIIDSRPPSTTGLESHCSTTRSVEPNTTPFARVDTDMKGLYVASLIAFSKSLASCWKTNSCLIMITPNMNWPLRTLSQWVAALPPLPLINGRMPCTLGIQPRCRPVQWIPGVRQIRYAESRCLPCWLLRGCLVPCPPR